MADEKAFSHITVTTDDDDDVVIQAGARAVSRPVPVPVPEPDCAPVAEEPASGEAAAEEDVSGNPSSSRSGEMPRSSEEPCREQRLEDLSGAPMPKAQKAVLATALDTLLTARLLRRTGDPNSLRWYARLPRRRPA